MHLYQNMQSPHLCLAILTILLLRVRCVYSDCPWIYQMIDKTHSYCAEKMSINSLPPTSKEIELILEMHNQERFDVNAKDMQKMYWNGDLAEIAQRYAEHCDYNHDQANQRQAPRIPLSTGQNLAMGYENWTLVIQGWADEKNDFIYGSKIQRAAVGHYTQMVKDTAVLIGCGLAICPKSQVDPNHDWPYYVCNYVTGYVFSFCAHSYCLKYRQLGDNKPYTPVDSSKSDSKRLHDCRGLVCLYNGNLDLNSCQCKCEFYTSGNQCENLNCSTLTDKCDYGQDKSLCITYANIPYECPKFCGLCDRYDEMKKYYHSIEISTDIQIRSIPSLGNQSLSSVFIQLILVLFLIK